jgi:hypothetical protein
MSRIDNATLQLQLAKMSEGSLSVRVRDELQRSAYHERHGFGLRVMSTLPNAKNTPFMHFYCLFWYQIRMSFVFE